MTSSPAEPSVDELSVDEPSVDVQSDIASPQAASLPTVIVGGGFVGLFTALHLHHQHYSRPVILIDQHTRFSFNPLLYEYLTGEMQADEVVPTYEELLRNSRHITFVQGKVTDIDLQAKKVSLESGLHYDYQHLVIGVGSTQGYFGTEGAKEHSFPFRTQLNVEQLSQHLRTCLQEASECSNRAKRRKLLTVAVVGAGPAGVEAAATLADMLPSWYDRLGGDIQELKIVLINHGDKILAGDVNQQLQETAMAALKSRTVPVELLLGVGVTKVSADGVNYSVKTSSDNKETSNHLRTATTIWTAGTATNPLIENLPIAEGDRDKHHRPFVTPSLQLINFPDVFAAGDCAIVQAHPLPPIAQIAYQQGAGIAHNLVAIASGKQPQPVEAHTRGTLMKLGIRNGVANLFDKVKIKGKAGHWIRSATYLELLPTPAHDAKIMMDWLSDELFEHYPKPNISNKEAAEEGIEKKPEKESEKKTQEQQNHERMQELNHMGVFIGLVLAGFAAFMGLFIALQFVLRVEPRSQPEPDSTVPESLTPESLVPESLNPTANV